MLSILRKARLKDKEMRILMLGLDNAGKTTIVKKIMGEDVNTVSPTLGFIIKTIDYEGYKLNIWDVGGQKTLRSYWRNYFEKTDALIWVVDATDRLRIEDCREELHGLLQEERLSGASLLVFANKTDVGGCMNEREILEVVDCCVEEPEEWHENWAKLPKPESPRRELPNPSTPSRDLQKPPNIGQTSRSQSPRELPRPQSINRELPKPESPRDLPRPLSINKPESPLKGQFRRESQPGTPLRSPVKQANEVATMLDEFFGTSRPQREYRIDTADILMNRPQVPRVRTAGAQLFQLFGDGKKMPVPMHNERVLFEQEMYICPHEFTDSAGKKAFEVYFWAGDEVPASTLEDAQLFASREARALGGKLVKLQQGKETAEFLQALGGIVITRRGSSNKFDMLAPSILCGRRHLGQVAFDEVDFAPANLCAGFAYLITQQGKCYLWKGKGSNVDELSCARLIGMDLTLTGELIEVDDGDEPATFWDVFGGSGSGAKPHSADHWRLKPNYEKYCGRLFCSDAASRQQISEICPFSQADLKPSSVYILDAFFEMYIIVGRAAQAEYLSFRNALDFAQEYAILASGMEDRPFVPISTVVLEGIPRDLKRVFRKWTDDGSPTVMPQAGLKRGRSLRIVPLTQALQALSE
ncbi:hypothetical protein BN1723_006725 [Verticillium longisporum]|uniref:DUF7904 domain-containing protein n=1 Tax=Verticillium longisporum TaxID=100787 RepID=A0A0G4NH86_VERLO|nr:hypothetical protein BN1723_006725 [Verticillium longisporum]